MKTSLRLTALIFACITVVIACNSNSETSTTKDDSIKVTDNQSMEDNRVATEPDTLSPDQAFINFLVPANEKEIEWINAGINHGSTKELKDHAKMMLADHKKLGEQVSALLAKKQLAKPSPDTTSISIMNLKGKEWDKAWADKMVADHEDLLSKLTNAETTVKNAELKALATSAKPTVQLHLDMAKSVQGKLK